MVVCVKGNGACGNGATVRRSKAKNERGGCFWSPRPYLFTVFRRQRKRTVDLENELGIETNEVSNLGRAVGAEGIFFIPIFHRSWRSKIGFLTPADFPIKTIRLRTQQRWQQLKFNLVAFRSLFDELRD